MQQRKHVAHVQPSTKYLAQDMGNSCLPNDINLALPTFAKKSWLMRCKAFLRTSWRPRGPITTSSSLSDASITAEGFGKASRKPRMAFLIVGPPVVRLQEQSATVQVLGDSQPLADALAQETFHAYRRYPLYPLCTQTAPIYANEHQV